MKKLKLADWFNLIMSLWTTAKEVLATESSEELTSEDPQLDNKNKHEAVKKVLVPLFVEKKINFSGKDVDNIINFVVWLLKKGRHGFITK